MVGGGSKSAKGGPNPLADMDRGGSKSASGFGPGGPNPRGVQIRCDTGINKHYYTKVIFKLTQVRVSFSEEIFR